LAAVWGGIDWIGAASAVTDRRTREPVLKLAPS
jgi:hypothetical protein